MNTKQTPEQVATDAMQLYAYGRGLVANHDDARQTIIKAFQDRESLLKALEGMVNLIEHLREYPSCSALKFLFYRGGQEHGSIQNARTALNKARSES